MDLDDQIKLSHLLLHERFCRSCGERKNLLNDFYRTRKNRGAVSSSYSYECKDCTIDRIKKKRKQKNSKKYVESIDYYPDW